MIANYLFVHQSLPTTGASKKNLFALKFFKSFIDIFNDAVVWSTIIVFFFTPSKILFFLKYISFRSLSLPTQEIISSEFSANSL